jgi:hypothetical protein
MREEDGRSNMTLLSSEVELEKKRSAGKTLEKQLLL